ncbi:hypothetical protein HGO48_06025 [Wolbachia endosymbiont of Diaphorina citri]|uniref:hypothetical protein n=1 Tax=Wolbachia endosymbiont of Diaphorina citri TaxID=116598 RepID=UPI0007C4AD0A|nr:hypothetical protein [Wolbachia endosymbiont of Diaphorina citri]QJT94875.2 hypothetical protein HGO48_06025 [Wolbachia endosymbiont of Diaphorina citri]QJT96188.2 hypothetical protein HGO49_06585 [Wolbachia endosymbiont of Diaphorina citri]
MNLINKSNLCEASYKYYYLLIDNAISNSAHSWSSFYDDGHFLKAVEVILRSSIKDDSKYVSITSLILCLKNKDVNNNLQNKSNIVLYAMLINHGVIRTYLTREILSVPCLKRPNDKRSDVKMSDYLLDDQVIREDVLWLKHKDLGRFKELCGNINKMQDKETKETFENYLNQINSEERLNALKYTAGALASICVVTGIIVAIVKKSAVVGVVAAIAGMLSVRLLCSNKLECVNVTHTNKECATRNSNFFC